jgi:hypothetical protein
MLLHCFVLVSRVWDISSGTGPCFPLAGGLCRQYTNGKENLLIRHQQQANNLLSWINFTPHVISRGDWLKKVTNIINSTEKNAVISTTKLEESPKKLKNHPWPLFRPVSKSILSHNILNHEWLYPFKDVGWFSVDSLWELTLHERMMCSRIFNFHASLS